MAKRSSVELVHFYCRRWLEQRRQATRVAPTGVLEGFLLLTHLINEAEIVALDRGVVAEGDFVKMLR